MGVLVRHTVPDFLFLEGTIIGLLELFLIAVGLSMDAFAVSVCKGLSTQTLQRRHYLIVGAWFGGFQALMPTLGYLLAPPSSSISRRWITGWPSSCCPSLAAIC